ncbi:MAG: glutamine amidotransferase [Gammaproteobacteria bacterium]|nr:glutamine amidotransferase [Gammaproteobacteria bacterium]
MSEKTILLLEHHDNPRDDLATVLLKEAGFRLELCCPFLGAPLPESNEHLHGAVIYGGEPNVTEIDRYPFLGDELDWIENAISDGFPLVGICLGAQLIAHALGARVSYHEKGLCEFGYYPITPTAQGREIFPDPMHVVQAHLQYFDLPEDAVLLATGDTFANQAYRYGQNVYGLQFHPEISADIFRRWQNAEWAFYGLPGAQTRDEQDAILPHADPVQGRWFHGFLRDVFGSGR